MTRFFDVGYHVVRTTVIGWTLPSVKSDHTPRDPRALVFSFNEKDKKKKEKQVTPETLSGLRPNKNSKMAAKKSPQQLWSEIHSFNLNPILIISTF